MKITTEKLDFSRVDSKVGSKDNIKHKPGGGQVKPRCQNDFRCIVSRTLIVIVHDNG